MKADIEPRYFVYFEGKECTFSNCPWLSMAYAGGCKKEDEARKFYLEAKALAKRKGIKGSFSGKKLYVITMDGCIAGPMYDFGIGPTSGSGKRKLMVEFPNELTKFNASFEKEEALRILAKLRRYINDVCSVAVKYRAGSSKFW